LATYTVRELVDELKRRKDELDDAFAVTGGTSNDTPKNTRMSKAKTAYWKAWHAYKEQHPDATIAERRKAQTTARSKAK
jgi:hypothetical protein